MAVYYFGMRHSPPPAEAFSVIAEQLVHQLAVRAMKMVDRWRIPKIVCLVVQPALRLGHNRAFAVDCAPGGELFRQAPRH